ncbi:antirepressor (plasmid) [Clostridium botulinum]|uniref:Antirepressor n=1 Tax=Clostridium botulinum TaxID=1491 RepID=A0A9Q1UY05_CLOBO|nr:Rha family transcriptional regulator [Clostridium botulinum]AEB77400.1 antirepressor protein [Clostridium botulinum BKT015925]KEH96387.1 antirepressor [Clostridium botulinum C/D str. Sp77]KEH96589.1 antirepressor protein [Clostridium botulinum D str. 16868]KLU74490.1 antirepressor protein [Clostridium botulinum V891]KOA75513.1 antirepressor [Clostridium botulinum]
MNNLTVLNNSKGLVLDSRDVAEMMGKRHNELMQEIEGRTDGKNVGIIPTLEKGNFRLSEFFIESSYKVKGNNKTYRCYLVTKKGCEVLGNKQQGEKGILFTAKYVEKFNQMEQNQTDSYLIQDPIERAKAWIKEQEEKVLLIKKIEEDEPLVALAKKRLDKNGIASITDATKSFHLKRGQITRWAKNNGYIHKTITEVNNKGDEYFKIYDNGGFKNIGITEQGLQLINDNLNNIA